MPKLSSPKVQRKAPTPRIFTQQPKYVTLPQFTSSIKGKLCQPWYIKRQSDDYVHLAYQSDLFDQDKYAIFVNKELELDVQYFGWSSSSVVVSEFSVANNTFFQLLNFVSSLETCIGTTTEDGTNVKPHIVTTLSVPFQKGSIPKVNRLALR